MSGNTAPWQIRIKRDTAEGWALKNLILLEDEIGLEIDTRKFKIGNGLTPYALLPYGTLSGPSGLMLFISNDAENQLSYGTDGGLFVANQARDFLAYYILAKS